MIIIGTSGYHFNDWTGVFYPEGLGKEHWLEYYARYFRAVEINMTYYGMPKLDAVARWNDSTPDNFEFFVKIPGDATHKRKNEGQEISELVNVLEPLRVNGKLRGLLAQFPASFHANSENENYLSKLPDYCSDIELFVEFRHKSWDCGSSVELCRETGCSWVTVDQPSLSGLSGIRPAVSTKTAYVRFHGRNAETWYNPKMGDRYDWEYSNSELQSWIPRLNALEQYAETSYLFFNNCHAGKAIKSAKLMREILSMNFEVY